MQSPTFTRTVVFGGLENINCILCTEGQGSLFIGDIIATKKIDLLQKHNIRTMVSCSPESKPNPEGICVKYIEAHDTLEYDIKQHFGETYSFIRKQLDQGNNVLVHCHAGKSRSASIVIAFIMRDRKIGLQETLRLVRSKRPRVKPNESFLGQLTQYQKELGITVNRIELSKDTESHQKTQAYSNAAFNKTITSPRFHQTNPNHLNKFPGDTDKQNIRFSLFQTQEFKPKTCFPESNRQTSRQPINMSFLSPQKSLQSFRLTHKLLNNPFQTIRHSVTIPDSRLSKQKGIQLVATVDNKKQ